MVIILATLTLWLASCTTSRVEVIAPSVTPPDPYIDGVCVWEYDEERDAVVVPFWYFNKIYDYIIDSQASLKIYENAYKK